VLSVLGMVLLVFVNDFVTMALATDNVKTTKNPNVWNVRNINRLLRFTIYEAALACPVHYHCLGYLNNL
jgi:hypothetical protein